MLSDYSDWSSRVEWRMRMQFTLLHSALGLEHQDKTCITFQFAIIWLWEEYTGEDVPVQEHTRAVYGQYYTE